MKRTIAPLIAIVVFTCWAPLVKAVSPQTISWADLVPRLEEQQDPLAGLTEDEIDFVEWIIYLREYLPAEITPEDQAFYDEMTDALPTLKKKGIDVDVIIADRRLRAAAVNRELNGRLITLAGYLLPLDLSGGAVTEFLLVPYVGACIHAPPPPPNQIVHAVTAEATSFTIERLFTPVSVTGTLKVTSLDKELFLVDGSRDITVGYSLSVEQIADYKKD